MWYFDYVGGYIYYKVLCIRVSLKYYMCDVNTFLKETSKYSTPRSWWVFKNLNKQCANTYFSLTAHAGRGYGGAQQAHLQHNQLIVRYLLI